MPFHVPLLILLPLTDDDAIDFAPNIQAPRVHISGIDGLRIVKFLCITTDQIITTIIVTGIACESFNNCLYIEIQCAFPLICPYIID